MPRNEWGSRIQLGRGGKRGGKNSLRHPPLFFFTPSNRNASKASSGGHSRGLVLCETFFRAPVGECSGLSVAQVEEFISDLTTSNAILPTP